jgi:hypothetical protein
MPTEGFALVRGSEAVRTWAPPDGLPKAFCAECGGHLYADGGEIVVVRLGAVDCDPGIRPQWHQWVDSAPDLDAIPDDGFPRFPRQRQP